ATRHRARDSSRAGRPRGSRTCRPGRPDSSPATPTGRPVGRTDSELVTRAQGEALLAGLLDGGILYTRTEKYYRGGHAWGVEEQSIRLPDRYVYHSWQIYDDDGRLLHAVGAAVGEDGVTYERFFRSSHERFDAWEWPT